MKMNPICERASRAAARTPRFSASLCGGNALLSAVAIFLLGLMFQRAENTGELRYEEVLGVFHALIWTELALAALLVPASAASAVSGEREQKTLNLLFGAAPSPPSIILGNLLQNLIAAAIFVFSGLPVLLTALLFGGAGFTDLALLFGGILLSAALAGSLGLFFSALNRTTAVAIVETFAAEALLFFGPYGLYFLLRNYGGAGNGAAVLLWLSPLSLMEGLLFRATGHSDFALLGDGRLFEAALVPTVCLQLCLMGILLFLAVKVISPRRRKRKFTTEQNLIK